MASRLNLHELLCSILVNRNVYFQPPESIKISYPCIIYKLGEIRSDYANNKPYKLDTSYTLTLIHNDPDNQVIYELAALPKCKFERSYVSNGLKHYVFEIFY